jgi:hypothetical protein
MEGRPAESMQTYIDYLREGNLEKFFGYLTYIEKKYKDKAVYFEPRKQKIIPITNEAFESVINYELSQTTLSPEDWCKLREYLEAIRNIAHMRPELEICSGIITAKIRQALSSFAINLGYQAHIESKIQLGQIFQEIHDTLDFTKLLEFMSSKENREIMAAHEKELFSLPGNPSPAISQTIRVMLTKLVEEETAKSDRSKKEVLERAQRYFESASQFDDNAVKAFTDLLTLKGPGLKTQEGKQILELQIHAANLLRYHYSFAVAHDLIGSLKHFEKMTRAGNQDALPPIEEMLADLVDTRATHEQALQRLLSELGPANAEDVDKSQRNLRLALEEVAKKIVSINLQIGELTQTLDEIRQQAAALPVSAKPLHHSDNHQIAAPKPSKPLRRTISLFKRRQPSADPPKTSAVSSRSGKRSPGKKGSPGEEM